MKRSLKTLSLMFALGGVAACGGDPAMDAQLDEPGHEREGEADSLTAASQPGQTRVGLAWDNWVRDGDIIEFQDVGGTQKAVPFSQKLRLRQAPPASYLNDFLGAGLLGTAYVVAYQDTNGDGAVGSDEPLLGRAPKHLVLYVPQLTHSLKSALKEWGGIVNVDDLKPGFNLAQGLCRGENDFDVLQIIPNEPVRVASQDEYDQTSCLNYH